MVNSTNVISTGFGPSNEMLSLATEVYYETYGQIRASILVFEGKAFLGIWFELWRRNENEQFKKYLDF